MKYNANGTIAANSVKNNTRIQVGRADYTQSANLQLAARKVKMNQVAVLPTGSEWLKQRGEWTLVQ